MSLKNDAKTYPALSATYWLYKRKDYTTWRRVKDTDELYFWHRGTTLLVSGNVWLVDTQRRCKRSLTDRKSVV